MIIDRLAPSLGAEITGVDLASASASTIAAVRQALLDHQVLVVRDQVLTPADHERVTAMFGTPYVHPVFPHLPGHPPVVLIRNHGKATHVNDHWHSDVTFDPTPPKATLLYALTVPALGGDTQFANQYQAYEDLSAGMKQMLASLRAEHRGDAVARLAGRPLDEAPSAMHPVVRTHPEIGRKALFVCRAFTVRFEDMTREESRPLLEWLFAHCARYEITYRHRWRQHDLVIWDNRCTLHYAIHDHGDAPRIMHRTTVVGDRPV